MRKHCQDFFLSGTHSWHSSRAPNSVYFSSISISISRVGSLFLLYQFSVIAYLCTSNILLKMHFWVKMGNLRVQIKTNISNRKKILFNIYVNARTRSQSAARVEERKDTYLPASYRINS